MESFFLIHEILQFSSDEVPQIINNQYMNSISIYWLIKNNQNTLWEKDKKLLCEYLECIFTNKFPHLQLEVKLEPYITSIGDDLVSCANLKWKQLPIY